MRARETLQAVSRRKRVSFFMSVRAAGRQVCLSNLEVLLSTNLEYRAVALW